MGKDVRSHDSIARSVANLGQWKLLEKKNKFQRNTVRYSNLMVNTEDLPWISSSHCFQCALNTVHECDDNGTDLAEVHGINRKWVSADVNNGLHYPKVRYVVEYPLGMPQLPHHDHPGGEEYLIMDGYFSDTTFGHVEAPAFVRYPIGTDHAAMTEMSPVPSKEFTWWGLMEETIEKEQPQAIQLDKDKMMPLGVPPTSATSHTQRWNISHDGLETRIEHCVAGGSLTVHPGSHRRAELLVLFGELHNDETDVNLKKGSWFHLAEGTKAMQFDAVSKEGFTCIVKELRVAKIKMQREASVASVEDALQWWIGSGHSVCSILLSAVLAP